LFEKSYLFTQGTPLRQDYM